MKVRGRILFTALAILTCLSDLSFPQLLATPINAVVHKDHRIDSPAAEFQEDYHIGEEDELEISVYGDSDLQKTQTVRPGGRITFPLIGDVIASGLTPAELSERITRQLAAFVSNPRVTVIVTKYNSKKVSLLGQVKTPGLLRLSSDINLLEAISRAGGLTEDADLSAAVLVRDRQLVPVDFEALVRKGDLKQDVVLQPNDVVLIPSIKDKNVFVLGQVGKPSAIPLRSGLTLIESISRAEGTTEAADLQGAVLVRDGLIQPVDFDRLLRKGDGSQNLLLKPNDLVLIPDVKDRKVVVLGEVKNPLVVALKPGVTLVESISLAGGFTDAAHAKSVLLIRGSLGSPTIQRINVLDIASKTPSTEDVVLQPGDIVYVPRTFISNVTKFFQSIITILTPVVLVKTGIVIGPGLQTPINQPR